LSDSFVVVAWEPPTSLQAAQAVHALCPGNFYVHLGAQTPAEKGVGGRPHALESVSSAAGDQCWLWTGSHNLTASAAQGLNEWQRAQTPAIQK